MQQDSSEVFKNYYSRIFISKNKEPINEMFIHTHRTAEIHANIASFDSNFIPIFLYKDVILFEVLGKGGFGTVSKAYDKKSSGFIALKSFKENLTTREIDQIMVEDSLLQRIEDINKKQNNIFLNYYGVFCDPAHDATLLLKMESGVATLKNILSAGKTYNKQELFYVMKILIKQFAVLQENGIANRDVKPENVILVETKNDAYTYKVSDFGIGCELQQGEKYIDIHSISGCTRRYAAPEVLEIYDSFKNQNQNYNVEPIYDPFVADVYSLGLSFLEMMGFDNVRKRVVKKGLLNNNAEMAEYLPIVPLLKEMLEDDPKKRPDFKELEILINQLNIKEIAPDDEYQFYEIWKTQKENEKTKTFQNLKNLYEEHKELYVSYELKLGKTKIAKHHIYRALELLKELNKIKTEEKEEDQRERNLYNKREEIFCLTKMGNTAKLQGNLSEAVKFYASAGDICQKAKLSPPELDSLELKFHLYLVHNELADIFTMQGQYDKAIKYYEEFVNFSKIMGENSLMFAKIYSKIGSLKGLQGKIKEEEEYNLKALEIFLMNPTDPRHVDNLAIIYNNLGSTYHKLSNFSKSEEMYAESLKLNIEAHGEIHTGTASVYFNFSQLYERFSKNNPKIEEFLLKATTIYEKMNLENSNSLEEMANAYIGLGSFYADNAQCKKGEELMFKALKTYRKYLPDERYPQYAFVYENLGRIYLKAGDFSKSEENFLKCLEILKFIPEEKNYLFSLYKQMNVLYESMGDYKKAQEYLQKSIEMNPDVDSENRIETAFMCNALGINAYNSDDFKKAEEFFLKALRIFERLIGPESPPAEQMINNLANIYTQLGNYEKAVEMAEKSLKINVKNVGEFHEKTVLSYNTLIFIYSELKNFIKANEYADVALKIAQQVLGENHHITASIYQNSGAMSIEVKDFQKAEENTNKSLEIRRKIFGENSRDVAFSYCNFGKLYHRMGNLDLAEEFYLKGLQIRKSVLGEEHSDVGASYSKLGGVYWDKKDKEKAKMFGKMAYEIIAKIYGKDHKNTKEYLDNLNLYNS